VTVKAKELRHAVRLDSAGTLRTEGGSALAASEAWAPEHLLLAALVECSLKSLRYHADRAGIRVRAASGSAASLVTKRETDGRYGIVGVDVSLDVELEPQLAEDELVAVLLKAERDCFVGASLRAGPAYRWSVGGASVDTR
jgi:organic hydroperoxide reductase OsmC/OhrA